MALLIIQDCKLLDDGDCRMVLEFYGKALAFVARRIQATSATPGVGDFEPAREFRDTPLSAHQIRELVRIALLVHGHGTVFFPMEVPTNKPEW